MEKIKELNMNELDQVNGGATTYCIGIGFALGAEIGACSNEGVSVTDSDTGAGAVICYYVGIGAGSMFKDPNK